MLLFELVWVVYQELKSSVRVSNISVVAQMEQVAAQESQGHVSWVWMLIIRSISIVVCCKTDKQDDCHLDKEYNGAFEEVVIQVGA